jgi:BirA family biotin operon repressor/biotin-[acetyl-CoA-carboxylase] ligase
MASEAEPRDPALEALLARHLGKAPPFITAIRAYQRVGSTMDLAHAAAESGAPEGTLVWAARQDRGRGRQGRAWESPEGGVYCSLIVRPKHSADEVPQLSLVTGMAVAEAIRDATTRLPSIRWPNDVLMNNRKVAGILVEARASGVVVGIGINVTTKREALPASATSLEAEMLPETRPPDPYRLTGALCRHFETWYRMWSAEGFAPIRTALRSWMSALGQPVRLAVGSQENEGTIQDLDELGRLLVRLDSGIIKQFEMGEVTLLR